MTTRAPAVLKILAIIINLLIIDSYGHHKWAISLAREDKALSVLLVWRGGAQVGTRYLVLGGGQKYVR